MRQYQDIRSAISERAACSLDENKQSITKPMEMKKTKQNFRKASGLGRCDAGDGEISGK